MKVLANISKMCNFAVLKISKMWKKGILKISKTCKFVVV